MTAGNSKERASCFSYTADALQHEFAQEVYQVLKHVEFRAPSILDFYPATKYGATNGVVSLPLTKYPESVTSEPILKGILIFIYLDEKWHLCNPMTL